MPNRRRRGSVKTHGGCRKRRLRSKKRMQRPMRVPYPRSEPIPASQMGLFVGMPSWGFPLEEKGTESD